MAYKGLTEAHKEGNKRYLAKFAEIRIRLLPEEKKEIEKKADRAGKSVNQFLKDLALKKEE